MVSFLACHKHPSNGRVLRIQFMKIKIIPLFTLPFLFSSAQAQGVVDDFNGTSINPSLWAVTLPYGDSSVTEGGGALSIENNGRLTTQAASPASYSIYGSFLMANNPYSNFKVVLRTDGTPDGSEADGIAFELNIQDDGGSTTDNLKLFTIGDSEGNLASDVTANLTLNTWNTLLSWRFKVIVWSCWIGANVPLWNGSPEKSAARGCSKARACRWRRCSFVFDVAPDRA
jgi:hypothetical protein